MPGSVKLFTDGGSRGNPGPAGAGFVIKDDSGRQIIAKGVFLGNTTNNVAEYAGLYHGLTEARNLKASNINIFCDSDLVVKQVNGQYRVKNAKLKTAHKKVMATLDEFDSWQISHVYREENTKADEMANRAMDKRSEVLEQSQIMPDNTPPIRLGVLISGGGRTMLNILDEIKQGSLNAQIAKVICSRSEIKGLQRARDANLPVEVIRKKDHKDLQTFSDKIAKSLQEANVDLVIQAGWLCLWIIPKFLENRVMNIHPALLPAFGGQGMFGRHVHKAVLERGCKVSGCTVHFCTNEYDQGPIIVQRCCPVEETDDADSLAARVFEQECIAYPHAIKLFQQGKLEVLNGIVRIK